MSNKSIATIAPMGIDIGKNSFHVVGLDRRGAIVLRQKRSRGQLEAWLTANGPERKMLRLEVGYDARPQHIDEASCDAGPDDTSRSIASRSTAGSMLLD